jgi:hypothetical protein
VQAEVTLAFANPGAAVLTLENPDGLTPGSPELPPYSDEGPNALSRLYVWFPWGDGAGDLTTAGNAESVVARVSDPNWYVTPASDPNIGVYWLLFPRGKKVFLGSHESVEVSFSGIVSYLPESKTSGPTWGYARLRHADRQSADCRATFWKEALAATLTASRAWVTPGQHVTLTWGTTGAEHCALAPGDHSGLPPRGTLDVAVPPEPSTTYTVTAFASTGWTRQAQATVTTRAGWIDLGEAPWRWFMAPVVWRLADAFVAYNTIGYEVWASADGASWGRRGTGPALDGVSLAGASDGERAWLIGSRTDGRTQVHVSTDGAAWTLVTDQPPWGALDYYAAAAFSGALWVLGGIHNGVDATNDVWASHDGGATWSRQPAPPWQPRSGHLAAVAAGRLWVSGGMSGIYQYNDLWSTADGAEWTKGPDVPGAPNILHPTALGPTRSHLYALPRDNADRLHLWRLEPGGWRAFGPEAPFPATEREGWSRGYAPWGDLFLAMGSRCWLYAPSDGEADD